MQPVFFISIADARFYSNRVLLESPVLMSPPQAKEGLSNRGVLSRVEGNVEDPPERSGFLTGPRSLFWVGSPDDSLTQRYPARVRNSIRPKPITIMTLSLCVRVRLGGAVR